jgi:ferric-dicitrate binding protein FerR (iron transport regulator)
MADAEPPPREPGDRDRAVARMEKTLRAMARERERTRVLRIGAVAAMAAALLLGLGVWKPWKSAPPPVATNAPAVRLAAISGEVAVNRAGAIEGNLKPDDRVSTAPNAHARLVFPSGATVELGPSTTIVPHLDGGEIAELELGSIETHVPKLGDRGIFGILTPNAQVIVHGTTFEVEVQKSDPRTHVHVTEGRVEVVSPPEDVFLDTGDSWPSSKTADVQPAPIDSHDRPAPSIARKSKPSLAPSTSLAEQNKLLQAALAARREGRDADALAKLDELLRTYPNSPLAQEAHANRFRALEKLGRHAEAVAEAGDYLATYPDGFARDEAKALVAK